jgi:hypothetical protein
MGQVDRSSAERADPRKIPVAKASKGRPSPRRAEDRGIREFPPGKKDAGSTPEGWTSPEESGLPELKKGNSE